MRASRQPSGVPAERSGLRERSPPGVEQGGDATNSHQLADCCQQNTIVQDVL